MKKQRKQQGTGLLALLGIGAGLYAWWKYRNMSPEKKEELHSKVNEVGQKVKDTYNDVESKVKDTYNSVESNVKDKYDDLKETAKKEVDKVQSDVRQVNN